MDILYHAIEERIDLSPEEFKRDYVGKKPVIMRGKIGNWPAITLWNENYMNVKGKNLKVKVKNGNVADKNTIEITFENYINKLVETNERLANKSLPIEQYYLHDYPLLMLIEDLKNDIVPFPIEFLPKWYHYKWWQNLAFYYGPQGSLTPMHFDNLGTHNLFFQVRGRKRFIIVPATEHQYAYMINYNHAQVDPTNVDSDKFPLFKYAHPQETIVNAGDVLYMPPYTLHYVRGLETSISMNIDWHTKVSVTQSLSKLDKGIPLKRIYYNLVYFMGIMLGINSKILYPLYRRYLMNG